MDGRSDVGQKRVDERAGDRDARSQRGRNEAIAAASSASGSTIPRSRVTFSPIGDGTRYAAAAPSAHSPKTTARNRPRSPRSASAAQTAQSAITPSSSESRKNGYSRLLPVDEEQRSLEQPDREQRAPIATSAAVEAAPAREERGDQARQRRGRRAARARR